MNSILTHTQTNSSHDTHK